MCFSDFSVIGYNKCQRIMSSHIGGGSKRGGLSCNFRGFLVNMQNIINGTLCMKLKAGNSARRWKCCGGLELRKFGTLSMDMALLK